MSKDSHSSKAIVLLLVAGFVAVGCPRVAVIDDWITLTESDPSATLTVLSAGDGQWRVASDDPRVTVAPSEGEGACAHVTVTAADFSCYYTARLTFENAKSGSDSDVVYVAVNGREPQATWCQRYGGTTLDEAYSVQQTNDGGYVVAGLSRTRGMQDRMACVVKTDGLGQLVWQRTFGEENGAWAEAVKQTTDGGYIVAGGALSGTASYALKTDSDGDRVWDVVQPDKTSSIAVEETSDSGFVFLTRDMSLLKLSPEGQQVWARDYEGWGYAMDQTDEGGFIMLSQPLDADDRAHLVRTDAAGNLLWDRILSPSGLDVSRLGPRAVQQTTDGNFVVAASLVTAPWGRSGMYLAKTDATGNLLWDKMFTSKHWDGFHSCTSARETSDGGFILVGNIDFSGVGDPPPLSAAARGYDLHIVKADGDGDLLWERLVRRARVLIPLTIEQASDGGYVIAGAAGSLNPDMYVVKTDANGNAPY